MYKLIVIILWGLLLVGCSTATNGPVELTSDPVLPDPQVHVTPKSTESLDNPVLSPTKSITDEPDSTQQEPDSAEMGPNSLLGIEITRMTEADWVSLAVDRGAELVRFNAVPWHEIEPEPGLRNWNVMSADETGLTTLGENGIEVILIIRGAPFFAQKIPGYACGPIAEESFQAFAEFMVDVVQRYSNPPYNVRYFEIGNEPDVGVGEVVGNSQYGCWGDRADPNFGGGYYAEMLKVVYPAIKAVNSDAQILIGGLLMGCDPTNPPEGKTCQETKFFKGILENGGGDYFDIVSYHAYVGYSNESAYDERWIGWEERGGVILGKLDYINELLNNYGYEKPIFLTEASMTCPDWNKAECTNPDEAYYQTQAQFVPRLYLRNWANGIDGTIWYQFEGTGWRYGGLAGPLNNPKPSLSAFKYLSNLLGGAVFLGVQQDDNNFVVYRFKQADQEIWSVWTPDWQVRRYELPDGVLQITDIYGNEIDISSGEIDVNGVLYLAFSEGN